MKVRVEKFVDERLALMLKAPLMWGGPEALECTGYLLIEFYDTFCRDGIPRRTQPSGKLFQQFARKREPNRPGPMTLAQWYTDPKWGCAKGEDPVQDVKDAGTKIMEFFIAYKAHLKAS